MDSEKWLRLIHIITGAALSAIEVGVLRILAVAAVHAYATVFLWTPERLEQAMYLIDNVTVALALLIVAYRVTD